MLPTIAASAIANLGSGIRCSLRQSRNPQWVLRSVPSSRTLALHSQTVQHLKATFSDPDTIPSDEDSSNVQVRGWVRSARHQKAVSFIEVVDGSTVQGLQVVLDAANTVMVSDNGAESDADSDSQNGANDNVRALATGYSVEVSGRLVPHPKRQGECELHGESVRIVGECDQKEYPLQKKYHSLEFLRQSSKIHLRPRTNTIGAATRVSGNI